MSGLDDLPATCFEGAIPLALTTVSADGVPNGTWLSTMYRVDAQHVALSCQFFRKTKANLEANPVAVVMVIEPRTFAQWRIVVRYLRSESGGPLFEQIGRTIDAHAAIVAKEDVFALRSADIFAVISVEPIAVERAVAAAPPVVRPDPIASVARLATGLAHCTSLEELVDRGLGFFVDDLGYERIGLYLVEASEGACYALGSRGYDHSGVGARVPLGVGIVGTCAEQRQPLRIAHAARPMQYARIVEEQARRVRGEAEREIPLPGLDAPRSILAVPLFVDGEVFAILTSDSRRVVAFDERDEQLFTIAGHLLAQGIALQRGDDEPGRMDAVRAPLSPRADAVRVKYYDADDSVFVDDDYVIKGLPGRILWLVLTLQRDENRTQFLNRELRLHPFLKLPAFKDNLETRLLMLQRRLDEKSLPIRLLREERGRLRLEATRPIELERIGP